jgi:hypothetical protein
MIPFLNRRSFLKWGTSFLVMAAVGSGMAILSWRKWPDILINFGRELYIPWQLNQGFRLYLDIAYFNGPFSPYVNSLIFKIINHYVQSETSLFPVGDLELSYPRGMTDFRAIIH